MNLYTILGIAPDADEEAIRVAYRSLARRYHPDSGDGSSSDKFRELTEAYETLSDPQRRRIYDRSIHPQFVPHVHVEPLTVQAEPLSYRARPMPSRHLNFGSPFRSTDSLDSFFDELMALFDDDLFFFR
jgi:curved DNA-binding protein CbpA